MAEPRAPVSRPVLLWALGAAQILGWGTTFYLPAVLGPPIGASLGLGQDIVFGGVTVMYLVGATLAPRMGRMIDARGARPVMAAGCLVAAAALALLALAQGLAGYVAAWVIIGVMLPMTLGQAGYAAIAQAVPAQAARRAMTLMTLMTGVTSTIAWPATAALEARLGWRGTCLAFAAGHLLIALPLYLAVLPRAAPVRESEGERQRGAVALPRGRFLLLSPPASRSSRSRCWPPSDTPRRRRSPSLRCTGRRRSSRAWSTSRSGHARRRWRRACSPPR